MLAIIGLQVGYLLGLTIRYVAERPKVRHALHVR
jgi:hypothetical protein